ncbi:serine hydrolase domain-containing protein [Arenivirga flava]|uniref:Serine hydrolase n=1 Tax=Arenivirga flava TaxID=1930060 RepID=A0AA37UL24_9MICO|nr:serine hydrolase domain-containing protein [Arenivirga flava]GMA29648.1 serine hydrolase [Arenivirga flava]
MKPARIIAGIAAAGVLAAGLLTMPRPPATPTEATGDTALGERLLALAGDGYHPRLSAVVVDDVSGEPSTRAAHLGADDGTEYEIGSVTKTMTGALLAVAVGLGEVEEGTRVGDLLEITGDAGDVTLLELATHTSGLPRLPAEPGLMLRAMLAQFTAADPYAGTTARDVAVAASSSSVEGRGSYEYSNLGAALLGHALAAAAGTDYGDLIRSRLIEPLALDATHYPGGEVAADAPLGFTASGRVADAWADDGYGPAGGVRATAPDLAAYAVATVRGEAPGSSATEPRADAGGDQRIGYGWHTDADGLLWHNGGTGGFSSMVAYDPASDRLAVVLGASTASVDAIAEGLLS